MKTKQIIVFRKDLLDKNNQSSMSNFAERCCNASVNALLSVFTKYECIYADQQHFTRYETEFGDDCIMNDWLNGSRNKEVILADTIKQILDLDRYCFEKEIPHALITKEGSFGPEVVCIGIGPWPSEDLDKLTKDIKE